MKLAVYNSNMQVGVHGSFINRTRGERGVYIYASIQRRDSARVLVITWSGNLQIMQSKFWLKLSGRRLLKSSE